jgi:hypothetical protein
MERGPDVMALDAGSTDSGAAYLAKGISKNNRGSVKRDLKFMMAAQHKAKIPILVGTSGQAGGDLNVNWTRDIVLEICKEEGYTPKIALMYSEQTPALIKTKLREGKITPLPPVGPLDEDTVDKCLHIVALMGPEPYFEALDGGADIILGGRGTDPAVIAAFALWKGAGAGPSWHAGKIGECGGQASSMASGRMGLFFTIDQEGFNVEPLHPENKATVASISGHLLYENKDPWKLTEPGGIVDVTKARYEQVNETTVRVTGSVWDPQPYTMKLEGASADKFQTLMIIGIADPEVLSNLDEFQDIMLGHLNQRAIDATDAEAGEFHISLRIYGWNGLTGRKPPEGTPIPHEVGMICVVTAPSQELASEIAKACNPYFFHMPIRTGVEMPSYGLIFSPADVDRGPVYEFALNHVVHVDDPLELVRTEWIDLAQKNKKGAVHA